MKFCLELFKNKHETLNKEKNEIFVGKNDKNLIEKKNKINRRTTGVWIAR